MKQFDTSIIEILNKECDGESVYHVGLGVTHFQISFGEVNRIQTDERAVLFLGWKIPFLDREPLKYTNRLAYRANPNPF